MIGLKLGLCRQPHHFQHRAHRTFARRQQRTDQQRLRLRPDTSRKNRGKLRQNAYYILRQPTHGILLGGRGLDTTYATKENESLPSSLDKVELRALGDEWYADYPGLLDFVDILKKRSPSFSLSQVEYDDISELCLKSAIEHPNDSGILREHARNVSEGLVEVNDFKRTLFMVFYRIGLIGLKLETFEKASWNDELGQGVSPSEIDDTTGIVVHTTYWRALGIKSRKTA